MNIETYAEKHPKKSSGAILPEILSTISNLAKGSKILDIGCAEGYTIQQLRLQFPDRFDFYGVDLSETRIQKALEKKIDHAVFCTGDAQSLPIEDHLIDMVVASQVIEHVPDDTKMLQEIERVLVAGGKFQIDTVYKKKWAFYFYHSPAGWAIDPTHIREYSNIDALVSIFPPLLKISDIKLQKCYRRINIIPFLSFLPDWVKIRIPGYFIIYILGNKL